MKKNRTSTKTKSELLEEMDKLKSLLLEARKEVKSLNNIKKGIKEDVNSLPELGISLIKVGKKFKKVTLAFDPLTKESAIKSIGDADVRNEDAAMALMSLKKFIVDNIYNKTINNLEGEKYESVEDFQN